MSESDRPGLSTMPNEIARSLTPQEEVFSSCDVLSQIMGVLMKELNLLDSGEAGPAVDLLAWWLQLKATCKTMSSVLHQLPLCIDFSGPPAGYTLAEDPRTRHPDDPAWQLLLSCTCPIATLRWASYLPCAGGFSAVIWAGGLMLAGSSRLGRLFNA